VKEKLLFLRFSGSFPSDRISKAAKDVNVRFFVYSLTFMYELVLENVLTVKIPVNYQRISRIF